MPIWDEVKGDLPLGELGLPASWVLQLLVGHVPGRGQVIGQRDLPPDVEQDVGLAGGHCAHVREAHTGIVEVKPLAVVDGKRSIVTGTSTKTKVNTLFVTYIAFEEEKEVTTYLVS